MFITHLLGFYISVFTLYSPVNFLCCAYMTNLFIQKVNVTESKHLTQKYYVSLKGICAEFVFVYNVL